MCQALSDFRREFSSFARCLDPSLLARADLEAALLHLAAIEKAAATLASLVAARMAAAGKAGPAHRQAARCLASASGTSLKEAQRAICSAEKMVTQPDVEAAARAGLLSRQQAAIVSEAAELNPAATTSLLASATTVSVSELAGKAASAKAAVTGLEAWREQVHRARSLRSYTDATGVWHLHAQGLPEDGARVMAGLQPVNERVFAQARRDGRREPPEAYAFDALVEMATCGGGGVAAADIVFRVDLAAFFRGYPEDGEVLEVAGFGPTSAQAVADILKHGTPFLKAVLTKGKDVVGVVHLGRRPNAYQKTALDWLYPSCAAEGCGVRTDWCQTDHRRPWASTHFTFLGLLDRLCRAHHAMKTNEGWALVEGKGKRPFVPPHDPRHPRFCGSAGRGAERPADRLSTNMTSTAQTTMPPIVSVQRSNGTASSHPGSMPSIAKSRGP
jgi:hypothetical protein